MGKSFGFPVFIRVIRVRTLGAHPHIVLPIRGWKIFIKRCDYQASITVLIPNAILPLDIHSEAMYSVAMIEKELIAASTEPLILSLLSKGESYGYELIQEVKRLSGEKINWTDGMLY